MNARKRHTPTDWDLPRESPAQVHREVRSILFKAVSKGKKAANGHRALANYAWASAGNNDKNTRKSAYANTLSSPRHTLSENSKAENTFKDSIKTQTYTAPLRSTYTVFKHSARRSI